MASSGVPTSAQVQQQVSAGLAKAQQTFNDLLFNDMSAAAKHRQRLIKHVIAPKKAGMLQKILKVSQSIDAEGTLDKYKIQVTKAYTEMVEKKKQEETSMEDLYLNAHKISSAYQQWIKDVAGATGGTPQVAPIKQIDRICQKKILRNYEDFSFARDIIRGSIVYGTLGALGAALGHIIKGKSGNHTICGMKDRFSNPTPDNYRDLKLNIFFSANGVSHICEVQLQHKALWDQREEDHEYYEILRKDNEIQGVLQKALQKIQGGGDKKKGGGNDTDELKTFLESCKAGEYLEAFTEMGVKEVNDLLECEDDDYKEVGCKKFDIRRIKKALAKIDKEASAAVPAFAQAPKQSTKPQTEFEKLAGADKSGLQGMRITKLANSKKGLIIDWDKNETAAGDQYFLKVFWDGSSGSDKNAIVGVKWVEGSYKVAMPKGKDDVNAMYLPAECASFASKMQEPALEIANKALDASNGVTGIANNVMSRIHNVLGNCYWQGSGKMRSNPLAETHWREAARLLPKWANYYYNLGLVQHHSKKLAEAKASFEKAISLKHKDAPTQLAKVNADIAKKS